MLGALGIGIVLASFGACVGALYLLQYLYYQRDRPGAGWFMGNIASVAVFCAAYGGALLVFDPTLRTVLEAISFVCVCVSWDRSFLRSASITPAAGTSFGRRFSDSSPPSRF
jgi:peptidoglycan biosynthesis protein MviN/MurJ (putative lipid II flippase)